MRQPSSIPARERSLSLTEVEDACEAARECALDAETPAVALGAAVRILHERLGSACVATFILEHGRLWLSDSCGFPVLPDGLGLDEGVVGRVVRSGRSELVCDVSLDPDFVDAAPGIVSELVLLLRDGDGNAVGAMNVETSAVLPEGATEVAAPLAATLGAILGQLSGGPAGSVAALARLFVYVGSLRSPHVISQVAARSLSRVLPVETCQLFLVGDDGELVESAVWRVSDESPLTTPVHLVRTLYEQVENRAVLEVADTEALTERPELAEAGVRSLVLAPLRAGGHEIGLLIGTSSLPRTFERQFVEAAALLAAHAGASLDAAFALERERQSALTDPLTGLTNRRGFEARLEHELERAQDERWPLSLLELDCDDFKEVNDRAGHSFGDSLLRELGDLLVTELPERGVAARLGGDEFVVMLPGVDADEADRIARDLQARLLAGLSDAGYPLRLSFGVATYPYDADRSSQLLRVADQALYEAKAMGKGHVVGFREVVRQAHGAARGATAGDRRRGGGIDPALLAKATEAASAIWAEPTVEGALRRLAQSLTFVIGATGCVVSKIEGATLIDAVRHALRDIDLGEDVAYRIEDFPVTSAVLETGASHAISFLDDDLDRGEAFVMRELQMNCCLLLSLQVDGQAWGLVEIYDMRLRRFEPEETAIGEFLTQMAGRRLEALGDGSSLRRRTPVFRLPWAG